MPIPKRYFLYLCNIIIVLVVSEALVWAYGAAKTDTVSVEKSDGWKKYIPTFNGELKARYEWNANSGMSRFNVRNARWRVNGYLAPKVSYRFFLDFNDGGNFTVLDTYVVLYPGNFEFIFGQQRADLDRNINPYFFANRSLLIKYLTTNCAVSHNGGVMDNIQGWRDIGISANYMFGKDGKFPVRLSAGVFNGSGMMNPIFTKQLSWSTRVDAGKIRDGWHLYGWYYDGWLAPQERTLSDEETGEEKTEQFRQRTRMFAAGAYYCVRRLYVEGETGTRFASDDVSVSKVLHTAYVQGIYSFPTDMALIKYVAPAFRWDIAVNLPFRNLDTGLFDRVSANRLTAGLNFGLTDKFMVSELRVNYEKFFYDSKPSDLKSNPLFQDKLTLELCIQF